MGSHCIKQKIESKQNINNNFKICSQLSNKQIPNKFSQSLASHLQSYQDEFLELKQELFSDNLNQLKEQNDNDNKQNFESNIKQCSQFMKFQIKEDTSHSIYEPSFQGLIINESIQPKFQEI